MKILGKINIDGKVLKGGVNFSVNEAKLNHLNQWNIQYEAYVRSEFTFYLIMQGIPNIL